MPGRPLRWRDALPILVLFVLSAPFFLLGGATGTPAERASIGALIGAIGSPAYEVISHVYFDGELWGVVFRHLPWNIVFGMVWGAGLALILGHR